MTHWCWFLFYFLFWWVQTSREGFFAINVKSPQALHYILAYYPDYPITDKGTVSHLFQLSSLSATLSFLYVDGEGKGTDSVQLLFNQAQISLQIFALI